MSEESSNSFVAPAGLLERVRNISQIYKQTVKLLPVQQGAVVNGNKITVQFPVDSVFDLRSLSFDAIFKHAIMEINQLTQQIIMFKHTIYPVMVLPL